MRLRGGTNGWKEVLMRRKKKRRLIVDVDSTEDSAHGKQENVAFNAHFEKNCFHPLFAFTSDGDSRGGKLNPGKFHSADGVLAFLDPIVKLYRSRLVLIWRRGVAAFADPEVYTYCDGEWVPHFFRLPANAVLNRLIEPCLTSPVGRPPKSGVQIPLSAFPLFTHPFYSPTPPNIVPISPRRN
ncbi:MAG: transposase [Desulfomonilaceae bacterium]